MEEQCTKCGKGKAMHSISALGALRNLCCKCFVEEGNPPAEKHEECQKAYEWKKIHG
jgi:hypothetical protein